MKNAFHRFDVDGLRGVAIALVVFFHVFVGKVSAGVDVFLLIGGIFFFGSQIRNAFNPAGLTIVQVLVRMLRRLFPALVTVILATLAAGIAVFPPTRWVQEAADAVASLAYVQNFALAAADNDYAAIGRDVSTYQHLWSMSVQLQIYVGSLLVITAAAWVLRNRTWGPRALRLVTAAATAASFGYALHLHQADQGWNYYSPLSRFWEIGLGGLFGFWLLSRPLPALLIPWRTALGAVGLGLIGATGIVMDGAAQFPGPSTLMPLAGAALVIYSGNPTAVAAPPAAITRTLSSAPIQYLGRISYSLYLIHWPLLVLVTNALADAPQLNLGWNLAVIVASILLADAMVRWVERPTRQKAKPGRRSWAPGAWATLTAGEKTASASVAAATAAVLGLAAWMQPSEAPVQVEAHTDYPGPAAFLEAAPVPDVDPIPSPLNPVETFYPATHADGCTGLYEHVVPILTKQRNTVAEPCGYGDIGSPRTLYVFGNSHADQMMPALDEVGKRRGLRILPMIKMGCYPGGEPVRSDGEFYPECEAWTEAAMRHMEATPASEGVLLISTQPQPGTLGPEQAAPGLRPLVERLASTGMTVWALRDSPWPHNQLGPLNVRDCVAAGGYVHGDPLLDCGVAREDALLPENPAVAALEGLGVRHLDVTDALCGQERCPGIIGNVLVYRDSSHMTNFYAQMLHSELERQMFGATLLGDG